MTDDNTIKSIIWHTVAAIPYGKVATYGQIAKLAGYPGYARYVGSTLKQLPDDSTLPWHRVINSRGEIAFSADRPAYSRQQERLHAEGVIIRNHKISLKQYQWQPD